MEIHVDPDICQGHTICNMIAPDIFGLYDEDGHSYVKPIEWTDEMVEAGRRAVAGCPEGAIHFEES